MTVSVRVRSVEDSQQASNSPTQPSSEVTLSGLYVELTLVLDLLSYVAQHQAIDVARLTNDVFLAGKGRAKDAVRLLSAVTDALVLNLEELALYPDDNPMCDFDRESFWCRFNDVWLQTMTCVLHRYIRAASADAAADSDHTHDKTALLITELAGEEMLDATDIQFIRNNVCAWGDMLERFGLVDYDLGFAESRLLDVIALCMTKAQSSNSATTLQQ
ncbi:hypothetical protein RI367_000608 [Sorochytrium milnesiophthora]